MIERQNREKRKLDPRASDLHSEKRKSYMKGENDMMGIDEYFKLQLEKDDLAEFHFTRYSQLDDRVLKSIHPVMKRVVQRIVSGQLEDVEEERKDNDKDDDIFADHQDENSDEEDVKKEPPCTTLYNLV